jgi:hypothetical protein
MATNTTKLGLIKPDLTDIVDIGDLNDNADDIDAAVGAAIVTSGTRPSSPWDGQIIHETDTNNTLVWDGTAWEVVSGAIAPGSITATELASNAVTTDKILDANVTTAKIADGNVTSAKLGPGSILQVVQGVKTDAFTTASGSFVALTGLTASITPVATSSKILVIVSVNISNTNFDTTGGATVLRLTGGNSGNYIGDGAGSRDRAAAYYRTQSALRADLTNGLASIVYLDSPATTSSVTYGVDIRSTRSTATVNRTGNDADAGDYGRTASSITLMEVAG